MVTANATFATLGSRGQRKDDQKKLALCSSALMLRKSDISQEQSFISLHLSRSLPLDGIINLSRSCDLIQDHTTCDFLFRKTGVAIICYDLFYSKGQQAKTQQVAENC